VQCRAIVDVKEKKWGNCHRLDEATLGPAKVKHDARPRRQAGRGNIGQRFREALTRNYRSVEGRHIEELNVLEEK